MTPSQFSRLAPKLQETLLSLLLTRIPLWHGRGGEGVRIGRGGGWLVVFVYVFPMDESDWLARGAYGDFYSNVGLDIRQARAKSTQHVWIDIY